MTLQFYCPPLIHPVSSWTAAQNTRLTRQQGKRGVHAQFLAFAGGAVLDFDDAILDACVADYGLAKPRNRGNVTVRSIARAFNLKKE